MNIKELTPKLGNVELTAEVSEVGQIREFNKFGKAGKVATARLKDETGEIELSLWNEQIDQIKKGDTIKVSNGYVKEYQGELQLTTGMRGTIEVVKKAEKGTEPAKAAENNEEPEDDDENGGDGEDSAPSVEEEKIED